MLSSHSWSYGGRLRGESTVNLGLINALALLFNRQRVKLRVALLTLDIILNLLGSGYPRFMPSDEEYAVIARDTEEALMKDYDVDKYVTLDITREGHERTYVITVSASPSLMAELMIMCHHDCEYYVDERIITARNNANAYFQLVARTLSILGRVFNIGVPRVLLVHNPTIYGKVLIINENEVIALSIWDLLRITDIVSRGDLTVNDISDIIDTVVHEFLHYLLDSQCLITSTFMEMTKRIPSVVDYGIIHELIAWTLAPRVSSYVAECIRYGYASGASTDNRLVIQYPIKRRHLLTARKIIDELLGRLDGSCE
ncbi:hypothetical protein [Vulcanisaeta souniana]|uniref:Uncharacterized protein n=1 Tax=Vulcanisaeta souniana JCM 11219 TaxID=1293586 RepID=A0A830EIC5_9CREN|nr:hypothetical protein [Vulcanisaeta souniana]BDR90939.1 hypothetical protein Vsou_00320 [Vulcanisaeta souniana JCM 11219]GGI79467.1 hypothetical protein GCM10007112_15490 [Vulcanisaeta souniana JCM 11219]